MRVAFLTHEPFYPPSGGGSAEAIYLIEELVRRRHEVHLFCPDFPDRTEVAERFGIQIHPFTGWKMGRYARLRNLKYLLYPTALGRLVRTVLRERSARGLGGFDVLLAQHTISAVAAGRLRRELHLPTVLNFLDYLTGFMETWPSWVMPGPVVRALTRFELSLPRRYEVDGVMTVSTPLADRFIATGYPGSRVRPIQYGYDAAKFAPLPPELWPGMDRPPVVVMHGSFDQHHLGAIASDALRSVFSVRPEVTFRFVGRETPSLKQFAAKLRTACPGIRLELTGFVPYTEVARRVADADLGLVPYEESNGTHCAFVAKAVEYLGCGLPVISTPLENLRRYFADEPAIRFSGFDGASFAAGILGWLDVPPPVRRVTAAKAAVRVSGSLDWRKVTANAVDFVEAVVSPKSGSA